MDVNIHTKVSLIRHNELLEANLIRINPELNLISRVRIEFHTKQQV